MDIANCLKSDISNEEIKKKKWEGNLIVSIWI